MKSYIGSEGTKFNFNSDCSGHMIIRQPGEPGRVFAIPCTDVLEWCAYVIRQRRIEKIEQMSNKQILDGID